MKTRAFAPHEWMIAWRYLRARRSEGGVSGMTWISLIGISLAVFALVATLSVRAGFRTEFVNTILGANAHASVYWAPVRQESGVILRTYSDYERVADDIRKIPSVVRVAPVVKGQVLASANGRNAGVQVFGETEADLRTLPLVANPETQIGTLDDFEKGVAIGTGVARALGLSLGDQITLTSPDGVKTAFGTSPRVKTYDVTYVFGVGRYDIDQVRIYMPLAEAQSYFNREGSVDELEIMIDDPDRITDLVLDLRDSGGIRAQVWTRLGPVCRYRDRVDYALCAHGRNPRRW